MSDKIKLLDNKEYLISEVVENMDSDAYYYGFLGKRALSSSMIGDIINDARTFELKRRGLIEEKDNPAFSLGRLIHLQALEPHRIKECTFAGKTKGTVAFKSAVSEAPVKEMVFTESEKAKSDFLVGRLRDNDYAREMLDSTEHELSAIGTIEGIPFRGKADMIKRGEKLFDLKTTTLKTGDMKDWRWSAIKYNYDSQAYIYTTLFGVEEMEFLVIDKATGAIGSFEASKRFIQGGREKVLRAVDIYNNHLRGKSLEELKHSLAQVIYKDTL
jgi:hypothetical protein